MILINCIQLLVNTETQCILLGHPTIYYFDFIYDINRSLFEQ